MSTRTAVVIGILIGGFIWIFIPESKASPEPQSTLIEFRLKTSDGVTHSFGKSIPFSAMESDYPNYECVVELENQKYRIGFWANSYPALPLSAVDIRYSFGDSIGGVGLAMPYKTFSAHSGGSSIIIEIFSTKFLDSLKASYPNLYKDNLNCYTF